MINNYIIFATVISIALGQFSAITVPNMPSFYIHDLLLFILTILNLKRLTEIRHTKTFRYALLFILSVVLLNPNLLYSIRISVYTISFLTLKNIPQDTKLTKLSLYISGVIILLAGYTQFMLLPDLRTLFYLGWDDHLNRLTFPYLDPNFTAIVLSMFYLWIRKQNKKLSMVFIPAVFLTYSRSAILSLLITMIVFMKSRLKYILPFLFLIILILIPKRAGEGNNLMRLYSIRSRIQNDKKVLHTIIKNPLIGHRFDKSDTPYKNRSGTANNSMIYTLQLGGLLTLITLLAFLKSVILKSNNKPIWTLVLVSSIFNNTLFYPFILPLIFIQDAIDAKQP